MESGKVTDVYTLYEDIGTTAFMLEIKVSKVDPGDKNQDDYHHMDMEHCISNGVSTALMVHQTLIKSSTMPPVDHRSCII